MRYRTLGKTGLEISEIGFGCGPTAGLIINGTAEQRRVGVARALELGVTYFDTAPVYGDTVSEANLGQAIQELGARPIVATKIVLETSDLDDIAGAVVRSTEASLERLRLDSVEVLQLHNRVATERAPRADLGVGAMLTVADVLGPNGVVEGLERVRSRRLARFLGCCAYGGEVDSVNQLIDSGRFDAILVYYNALNPTAFVPPAPGMQARDFGQVAARSSRSGMGVVVLRALDGGVLAGNPQRHPLSRGTNPASEQYRNGLARAQTLAFLAQGRQTLAEGAIRWVLSNPYVSVSLVGFSGDEQIVEAASASDSGPLSPADLDRVNQAYQTDFGFARA